jgi:hypothetical protein
MTCALSPLILELRKRWLSFSVDLSPSLSLCPVLLEGGWLTVMSSRSDSAKVCQQRGCGCRWWAKEAAGLRYAGGLAALGAWHGQARQDLSSQRWRWVVPRWHIQLASKHTNTKLQVQLRLPLLSSQQAAPPWAPSFSASPTWTPTQPQTDSRRSCPTKKLSLPPLLSAAAHPSRPLMSTHFYSCKHLLGLQVQRFVEQQQVSLKWITQGLSNSGR